MGTTITPSAPPVANPALSQQQVDAVATCAQALMSLGSFEGLTPAENDEISTELLGALIAAAVSVGVGAMRRTEA